MRGGACDFHVFSVFVCGRAMLWREACGLSVCVVRICPAKHVKCIVFFTGGLCMAVLVIFMFGDRIVCDR